MTIKILLSATLVSASSLLTCFYTVPAIAYEQQQCSNTDFLSIRLKLRERLDNHYFEGSTVLSSPHYCVAYRDNFNAQNSKSLLTTAEVHFIRARYNWVWSKLKSDDEKVAFAHLFLKEFSQRYLVYTSAVFTAQTNIIIPSNTVNENQSRQAYLTFNLSVKDEDYQMLTQGLEILANVAKDGVFLSSLSDMNGLIRWVIKGQGKSSYFDDNVAMLLPDGSLNYCIECYYRIDDILATGGAGYGGSYDWQSYANREDALTPQEGEALENDICRIQGNCVASRYWFYFDDEQDVGEECVDITYDDGGRVTGLYCRPWDAAANPE